MSVTPTDQRDLIEPLFAGLLERPCWRRFLQRLIARTSAERAGLLVRGPGGARLDRWEEAFTAGRSIPGVLQQLGNSAPPGLRPLRVYSYAELLRPLPDGERSDTASPGGTAAPAHGRWMRVPTASGWSAWVLLEHSTQDFTAADSALLSGLGPFIAVAIELLGELDLRILRAEVAEQGLAALGVSQVLLDEDGRLVLADAGTASDPGLRIGAIPQPSTAPGTEAARAIARVARGQAPLALVAGTAGAERNLLIRPAPSGSAVMSPRGLLVAANRAAGRTSASAMARALAALHGLSAREADLAIALARGEELVPAGARLGLTPETTRNYSKRIYAKTGARGQADLVRLVLSGLAPVAADF